MPETSKYDYIEVPPALAEAAQKLGLAHPIEALLCAPDRYEDYRELLTDFDQVTDRAEFVPVVVRVKVRGNRDGSPSVRGYGRRGAPPPPGGYKNEEKLEMHDPFGYRSFRLEIDIEDERGNTAIQSVFGSISRWKNIQAGDMVILRGNADRKFGSRLRFNNAEPVSERKLGLISPVYLGMAGRVSGENVQAMIEWVLEDGDRANQAFVAAVEAIRADCGGLSDQDILDICTPADSSIQPENLFQLLAAMHAPESSIEEGRAAINIASRICALGMQCRAQRQNLRPLCNDAPIAPDVDLSLMGKQIVETVELRTGFPLTNNQRSVALGVIARLQSRQPLNGLLSGEVGSGKTMAYAIPAATAHKAGGRVAIMAPTEMLANQIADGIARNFDGHVQVERVKTGGKLRNPDAILVGTSGLNTVCKKNGYVPDLLIFDEQHKLGSMAREALVGPQTHVLEVSATPIPRSLALSLYDGMDLFTLNEQPVKRNIKTGLIDVQDRRLATAAIRQALAEGARCAIVFTLVDPDEGTPAAAVDGDSPNKRASSEEKEAQQNALKNAIESAELFEQHFPGKVALLHGKTKDKAAELAAFRSGEKPLMITTTIFETGIDVPDVKVMVVRDPQQLGLSQLHQLRGRLARSGGDGKCFLLTEDLNALSDEAYERLTTFTHTLDGYALARADMLARGAGDLEGLQQKGRASTTFKGIKLTTEDLLLNESMRADLVLQVDTVEADPSTKSRQRQSTLSI